MRELSDRVLRLVESAAVGYFGVVVLCLSIVVFVAAGAYVAGEHSLAIGFGPLPVMSYWNSDAGWGFRSEWGLAVLATVGGVAAAAFCVWRQLRRQA